ncbi:hypothetical protein [Mesorhizobium sp. M0323]|uniref:hypothetical protein n=1 Tax=unclassified Mesorhizobium TaxID=325217 RepID=UPI00333B7368
MYTAISAKLINIAAAVITGTALLVSAGNGAAHAADFYQLVEVFGPANTSIVIVK